MMRSRDQSAIMVNICLLLVTTTTVAKGLASLGNGSVKKVQKPPTPIRRMSVVSYFLDNSRINILSKIPYFFLLFRIFGYLSNLLIYLFTLTIISECHIFLNAKIITKTQFGQSSLETFINFIHNYYLESQSCPILSKQSRIMKIFNIHNQNYYSESQSCPISSKQSRIVKFSSIYYGVC